MLSPSHGIFFSLRPFIGQPYGGGGGAILKQSALFLTPAETKICVLLFASAKRFSVSHVRDFLKSVFKKRRLCRSRYTLGKSASLELEDKGSYPKKNPLTLGHCSMG